MKTIILCDRCIEAIISHGEKVVIIGAVDFASGSEMECDFCHDKCDASELYYCELR